jgi:digeranylgeranylglycerophospholipid reductase
LVLDRMLDALVVGAGPAGSRVAREIADAGLDVVVIEEHGEVGVPCHCSGLVTERTLDLADVGSDIVVNVIRGASVTAHGTKCYTLGGGRPYASVIDRVAMDRRLATQAVEAGAELRLRTRYERHESATGAAGRPGHLEVHVTAGGAPGIIRTRLLVGCDGARSKVARFVRPERRPVGVISGLGALATFDPTEPQDHVQIYLDRDAAPGWFGWTIPLADGTARLGTGSGSGVRAIESFRQLQLRFPDSFGASEVLSHTGGSIPLWEPGPMVADRVMLVGDAARQVKPTSGGGIYQALFAAQLAGSVGARALERDELSAADLRDYEVRWKRGMQGELLRQRDLRRAFVALDGGDIGRILKVLDRPEVRCAIEDSADIDFPSRAAIALLRHEPLLAIRTALAMRSPFAWIPMARPRARAART